MADGQPNFTGHAMIALYPSRVIAKQLALDGGQDPTDLHCTVVYLGHAEHLDLDRVHAAAEYLADRNAITATISGHARFTSTPGHDALVALVDAPALEALRRDALAALATLGVAVPAEHGFTPHITLAYIDPATASPVDRITPVSAEFGAVVVAAGGDHTVYPFTSPSFVSAAREAFAVGWASTRGPWTARTRAASEVAVQLAVENHTEPGVLETTLHLGALEGTWGELYERREEIYSAQAKAVMSTWRGLVRRLDVDAFVSHYRELVGLTEAARGDDERHAVARAQAITLLHQLLLLPSNTPELAAILHDLATALRTAQAEGVAGGYAVAAQQNGGGAIDFDRAFREALDEFDDLSRYQPAAKELLADIVNTAAADLGRLLVRLTAEVSTTASEMTSAIGELLDGDDVRAVDIMVDLALGQAFTRGTISVYLQSGARTLDFVSAGDGRVCPSCQQAQSANPYLVLDAPLPPRHPYCRCNLQPHEPLTALDVSRFQPGGTV